MSCGSEIRWIKTESGKNMPVDPEPVAIKPTQTGNVIVVTDSGKVKKGIKVDISEVAQGTAIVGHKSHFATCPFADKHRRK